MLVGCLAAAAGAPATAATSGAVRARESRAPQIVVLFRSMSMMRSVRIYKTLHASLNNAKNYDLSILYDPDALATCCGAVCGTRRP